MATPRRERDLPQGWQARRGVAGAIRVTVALVPLAAAIITSGMVATWLPRGEGLLPTILWWIAALGSGTLASLLVEREAVRFLPLVALYNLTVVFPDHTPSRFKIARKASSVDDARRAMEAVRDGTVQEAAEAALSLITALEVHHRATRGHAERVRLLTDLVGEELGLDETDRIRLRWAALLHDLGKLHVHTHVLNSPSRPTDEEWEQLRRHPLEGARLCEPLVPWLGDWALAVVEHHERYDGTGYPHGTAGKQLSLAGRIVSVTDAYEVMTARRTYKSPSTPAQARQELVACAGTHFDPDIVRAFLRVALPKPSLVLRPVEWLLSTPGAIRARQVTAGAREFVSDGIRTVVSPTSPGGRLLAGWSWAAPAASAPVRSLAFRGVAMATAATTAATLITPTAATPDKAELVAKAPFVEAAVGGATADDGPGTGGPSGATETTPDDPGDDIEGGDDAATRVTPVRAPVGGGTDPAPTGSTPGQPSPDEGTGSATPRDDDEDDGGDGPADPEGDTAGEADYLLAGGLNLLAAGPGDHVALPVLPLSTDAVNDGAPRNLDADRNADPGLTLTTATPRPTETVTGTAWVMRTDAAVLALGSGSVDLFTALPGMAEGEATVHIDLLDCANDLTGCVPVASATSTVTLEAGDWTAATVALGDVSHVLAPGRALTLAVTLDPSSTAELWLAAGASQTPSRLNGLSLAPANLLAAVLAR